MLDARRRQKSGIEYRESGLEMLKFFLWLRYLRKRKIVLLSVAAVALSCALLVVVASLFNGFIEAVEKSYARFDGDIRINFVGSVSKYDVLLDRLEELPEVETGAAFLWGGAGLLHLGKGNVQPVFYAGIDPVRGANLSGLQEALLRQKSSTSEPSFEVPGHPDATGVWVGIGLVAEPDEQTDEYDMDAIKEIIGDRVVLITGTWAEKGSEEQPVDLSTTGPKRTKIFKRITKPFRIADVFFTGNYWYDQILYLPIEKIHKIVLPGRDEVAVHTVGIKLSQSVEAEKMKGPVRAVWQRFAAEELGWDKNKIERTTIYTTSQAGGLSMEVVRKQMGVLMLILGVISSVGVLLVFCIFYMIVITKRRDIAIIKSCGTSSGCVASIFVGFGVCVGVGGSALGTALGYVIIRNINAIENWVRIIFGFKLWRSSIYIFDRIPSEVDWGTVWWIVPAAIAASALGALIPAIVAARTKPVEILRYE